MTERIEEFTRDGKIFVYIDFSGITSDEDFSELCEIAGQVIAKYPEQSLYTISNIEKVRFDSNTKEIVVNFMQSNKPYVKYGIVIGIDGIKKMMVRSVLKLSGRANLNFCFTKEEAIDRLLKRE